VRALTHLKRPGRGSVVGVTVGAILLLAIASCQSPQVVERRTDVPLDPGPPRGNNFFHEVSYGPAGATVPKIEGAELVNDDELCAECHPAYSKAFANNVHRGDGCESCHGPASKHLETRGKEPGMIFSFKENVDPWVRAEACLRCHEEHACTEGARWRTSKHAHCGVTCTDCHRGHYDVPPGTPATQEPGQTASSANGQPIRLTGYADAPKPKEPGKPKYPSLRGTSNHMGAIAPGICYRCHSDFQEFQEIAGPHQICGPNGFNCTTCHDAHGNIIEYSREELCLSCHRDYPLQAWHTSTHERHNVACTDCHNPHPHTSVPQFVNISRTDVRRHKRLPMSVQEPEACYKCHQKMFGLASLPSRHPIKEGKMVCSDCHESHGQFRKGLKADSVNMVCYECHAEKEGPFVWEHPPVTENCAICHEPHGTVANNLLRQPTTFLCLRCHVGHRKDNRNPDNVPDIDQGDTAVLNQANARNYPNNNFDFRQVPLIGMYTDCTNCHSQIHGSDIPSQSRRGRLTR